MILDKSQMTEEDIKLNFITPDDGNAHHRRSDQY